MMQITLSSPIYRYTLITLALVTPLALTTPVHAQSGDTLPVLMTLDTYGFSAAYSPDGSRIVTGSGETAEVWDASSGRLLMTLEGHTGGVKSATYSPDGSRIVTASSDGTAKVWDASSGRLLQTLEGHTKWVFSAAYSPDGSRIVTSSEDKTAKVWDASSGRLLKTLEGHKNKVLSATYSPDGSRIVTASSDGTAKVWDASSGRLLMTLEGHTGDVKSATYSPDGSRIVTSSEDNTAKVWDASSGRLLQTLEGHKGKVRSASYSPDGSTIVTASADGTAKVWDASNGQLLKTLEGHTDFIFSAVYSPDGSRIVTGSSENTKVWDASSLSASSAPTTKPKLILPNPALGSSIAQTSSDGPFGLRMGMSLKEIIKIDPNFKKLTSSDIYSIKNSPIPNSFFKSYILIVTPKAGLCKINAIGVDINSSDFGDQIKEAFDSIESILNTKYSRGYRHDYLKMEACGKTIMSG